jgi:hypothetical protein
MFNEVFRMHFKRSRWQSLSRKTISFLRYFALSVRNKVI